jgi:hypothetical protein
VTIVARVLDTTFAVIVTLAPVAPLLIGIVAGMFRIAATLELRVMTPSAPAGPSSVTMTSAWFLGARPERVLGTITIDRTPTC